MLSLHYTTYLYYFFNAPDYYYTKVLSYVYSYYIHILQTQSINLSNSKLYLWPYNRRKQYATKELPN